MSRVYMDANATTPLLPEVVEAMRPYWMERFGNASSIHLDGQQAHTAVDRARATLAEFFNCHDAEVVFNSGGTEGDNTAIFGLLRPGDHFVTTSIEHSAILEAAERMARHGVETTFVAPQPRGLTRPLNHHHRPALPAPNLLQLRRQRLERRRRRTECALGKRRCVHRRDLGRNVECDRRDARHPRSLGAAAVLQRDR